VNEAEEAVWVQKSQAGDDEAFAQLVDHYWGRLCRWLFTLSGSEHLAEDLTQDAFLKAWSALPQLKATETFRVWLFRIAQNEFYKNRRGPRAIPPDTLPSDLPGKDAEPLGQVLERESSQFLQTALAQLPSHYRAAYLLWVQEAMPYSQIAAVLTVTEETARWRVCKARRFLVKHLQPYLNDSKR
jgi:RNA polymerase sigma-70 factor, ECF subfamily